MGVVGLLPEKGHNRTALEDTPQHRGAAIDLVSEQMCRQSWMNTTLASQPTTSPSRVTYTS